MLWPTLMETISRDPMGNLGQKGALVDPSLLIKYSPQDEILTYFMQSSRQHVVSNYY